MRLKSFFLRVFRACQSFITENIIPIFFILALYGKLLLTIVQINGKLAPFPTVLYPLVFCALIAFIVFIPTFFVKRKLLLGSIISFFFTVIFIFDLTYSHYFNSIPSVGLLSFVGQTDDVAPAVMEVFRVADLLYFLDIVVAILGSRFLLARVEKQSDASSLKRNAVFVLIGIAVTLLAFLADSDRFLKKATTSVMDNKVVAERYGLIGAHFFDIYRELSQRFSKISDEQYQSVVEWMAKNRKTTAANDYTAIAKGKNIIMIQVESLQSSFLNQTIEGQEITPNLNALMADSNAFNNNFYIIGAGSTSDADFTINSSYYPLSDSSVFVRYSKDAFTSLAKELKEEGYSAYSYHGYNRSFWNRAAALNSLGYEKFYAQESYSNGTTVGMGLDDMTFLTETADFIKAQPKPSFSYVITLSSHYPFYIPENLKGLTLDESKYPETDYNYVQAINYTDRALGAFIDKLKSDGLYDDSLIVLYGDHYAKLSSFSMDNYNFDPSNLQDKQVPLLIKLPNETTTVEHNTVSSHIDVMPTILNLIGAKADGYMFGTDLFSGEKTFFASVSALGSSTIIGDGKVYRADGSDSTCSTWDSVKAASLALSDCDSLVARKTEEQSISSLIVRYNLFEKIFGN